MNRCTIILFSILMFFAPTVMSGVEDKNKDSNLYFTSKAEIEFIDHEDIQQFKSHIRYKKGDSLWMSFTGFMGIEGARIMVKKDSTYVINKLENTFLKFTNHEQNDLIPFGISLEEWDLILLNSPIKIENDSNTLVEKEGTQKIITQYVPSKSTKYFLDSKNNLTKMIIDNKEQNTICEIQFSQFKKNPITQHDISHFKSISIKSEYNDVKINISYLNINFNQSISMPFSYSK